MRIFKSFFRSLAVFAIYAFAAPVAFVTATICHCMNAFSEPAPQAAVDRIVATAKSLKVSCNRFAGKVFAAPKTACHGFVALLKSLDQSASLRPTNNGFIT